MTTERIDPQTITLGDLIVTYSREQGLKKPLTLGVLAKYADMSALEFFDDTGDDVSPARTVIRTAQESGKVTQSSIDNALKVMRYSSNRMYNAYDRNPPSFLISNEKNVPKVAAEFFGAKQGPKAVSQLQVLTDDTSRQQFFDELIGYAEKTPDKVPHIRAIIYGLNTGLRPNANIGLKTYEYMPEKQALYIRADATGAKGIPISIPLNNMADSMLQQQIRSNPEAIKTTGQIWVDTKGKPLTTSSINDVLAEIKVPGIVYDASTDTYYDSLKPKDGASSKFGMSLFRNYHTTLGRKIGINDLVLAKAQGRSTKSYGRGSTGELSTYDSAYPGDVDPYERDEVNKLARTYGPHIEEALNRVKAGNPEFNFDYGVKTDIVTTRITEQTGNFGREYFKRPVADKVIDEKPLKQQIAEDKNKKTISLNIDPEDFKSRLDLYTEKLRKFRPQAPTSIGEEEEDSPSVGEAVEMAGTAVDVLRKPDPVEEEGSFATPPRGFINRAGRVAGKVLPYAGLTQGVLENLQPSEEGQPRTAYDLASGAVDTAKDLFSRERGDISPSTSQEPSTNPEYNLSSEMQQSLQKPTPAYMTDSRPFEERLQEYKQYMQSLREGK